MNRILRYLDNNDFEIVPASMIVDNGLISHIYTKKDDLYFCIISPHEGNHFKFLLRANPVATFDRWGVCDFEKEFDNSKELVNYLENNMIKIYQEILAYYVESE